ncbi:MAG: uroporphyrinogen-III synthase [Nitrospinota bacterium]|nr:uroporphyrinogen-III synthase [Nitrospinota bacterium]MDP7371416.1 uroporphyrinogen-III synthase [Nitrospinota bacterium]MDP7503449.1 uroporphyrinogen-III synthase [Nitrospinota bacterium]MDP7662970.1 uroporphyrinogen-III synthase [Nitrospinota bacterium]HJP12988.1 uroporphyrinogen-III synthase [Nitrospinota bacterium]
MPSLDGRIIVITGQRRAGEMSELVRRLGGEPYIASTVSLRFEDSAQEAERLAKEVIEGVDWAVFYTGVGVRALFDAAESGGCAGAYLESLKAAKVLSRGRKALRALREGGRPPDFQAEPGTTEGVISSLTEAGVITEAGGNGASVFIQTPGAMPSALPRALAPYEVRLIHGSPYRILPSEDPGAVSRLIGRLLDGGIDAITFTSPPAVNNLFVAADEMGQAEELAAALNESVATASIGPVTSDAIRENGVEPALETESQRMGGLLQDLAQVFAVEKS